MRLNLSGHDLPIIQRLGPEFRCRVEDSLTLCRADTCAHTKTARASIVAKAVEQRKSLGSVALLERRNDLPQHRIEASADQRRTGDDADGYDGCNQGVLNRGDAALVGKKPGDDHPKPLG